MTRCILVERSDTGTYTIPGSAEEESWDAVLGAADSVERYGYLRGWGEWTAVYVVKLGLDGAGEADDGYELWYFVAE